MNSKMAQPKHNDSRISEFGPNAYTTPYLNFVLIFLLPSSSTPASKLYVVKFSRGDGSATTSTHTFRTSRAKLIR